MAYARHRREEILLELQKFIEIMQDLKFVSWDVTQWFLVGIKQRLCKLYCYLLQGGRAQEDQGKIQVEWTELLDGANRRQKEERKDVGQNEFIEDVAKKAGMWLYEYI